MAALTFTGATSRTGTQTLAPVTPLHRLMQLTPFGWTPISKTIKNIKTDEEGPIIAVVTTATVCVPPHHHHTHRFNKKKSRVQTLAAPRGLSPERFPCSLA